MATIRDKNESNSEETRGRIGPVAGRAPTVAPAASRTQERVGTDSEGAAETGSPGAMEDEEGANGRQ